MKSKIRIINIIVTNFWVLINACLFVFIGEDRLKMFFLEKSMKNDVYISQEIFHFLVWTSLFLMLISMLLFIVFALSEIIYIIKKKEKIKNLITNPLIFWGWFPLLLWILFSGSLKN